MSSLEGHLRELNAIQPRSWTETGAAARPNLHGLLRYPAMMVPCMQGDILDAILASTGRGCAVLDPFVGSGTAMTEALLRGLDFTGVDINPLAILVCEAKAAIDRGTDVEGAVEATVQGYRIDATETIDVDFPGLGKWFDEPSAVCLSRIRRSILKVEDEGARKVMWTAFAETIRLSSNSRTSTYKLHVRPEGDRVGAARVLANFEASLGETLERVHGYRRQVGERGGRRPRVDLICGDVRRAELGTGSGGGHRILITSPPYGDNHTTIPYGQFSYLAMSWIPTEDLKAADSSLVSSTHALDTASLGGSLKQAQVKADALAGVSTALDRLTGNAAGAGSGRGLLKVGNFLADLFEGFARIRDSWAGSAHWVVTVGNRTAHGVNIPFDEICQDMLCSLGGRTVASVQRDLPNKRMPRRNGLSTLINRETTLVVEFA